MPSASAAPHPVFFRAVVLLVLLVCLDLWASRHLGIGLSRKPAWLAVLTTAWVAAASLLDRALEAEEKKSMERRVQAALRRLLTTPALVILALLLAVLSSSYSSVEVLRDPGARPAKLGSVGKEGGAGWLVGGPDHFLVRCGPFGRDYRLTVPGYLPAVLTVPPWLGLRIVPERDLRKPSSFLLRPLPTNLATLENGGALEVWQETAGRRFKILTDSCGCRASFLLGRDLPIPAGALTEWRLELLSLRAAKEDSDTFSQTLLEWRHPRHLAPSLAVPPGSLLTVLVKSRARKVVARTTVTVTEEGFQDILLE